MEGETMMLPDTAIESTVTAYEVDPYGTPRPVGTAIANVEGSSARGVSLLSTEPTPREVWVTYFFERINWRPHYVMYANEEGITSVTMDASITNDTDSEVRRADIALVVGDVPLPRLRSGGKGSRRSRSSARGGDGDYESYAEGAQPVMLAARMAVAAPLPQGYPPEGGGGGGIGIGIDESDGFDVVGMGSERARIPLKEDSLPRGNTDRTALVIESPDSFKAYYCDVTPQASRVPYPFDGGREGSPVFVGYRFVSRGYLPAGEIVVFDAAMNLLGASRLADTIPGKPTDVVLKRSALVACDSTVTVQEREILSGGGGGSGSRRPSRGGGGGRGDHPTVATPRWISAPQGVVLRTIEEQNGERVGGAFANGGYGGGDDDDDVYANGEVSGGGGGGDDDGDDDSSEGVPLHHTMARRRSGVGSGSRRRGGGGDGNGDEATPAFTVVEKRTRITNRITNSTDEEATVLLKCAVGDDVYEIQPRPNGPTVGGKAEWAIGVPATSESVYEIVIVTRNMVPKRGGRPVGIY